MGMAYSWAMQALAAIRHLLLRGWGLPVTALVAVTLLIGDLHCEVGGMKALKAEADHSCCASTDSAPAETEYSECCASLAGPLPTAATAPAVLLQEVLVACATVDSLIPSNEEARGVAAVDFGPPDSDRPPIVIDLRRVQPAHAPPFVV